MTLLTLPGITLLSQSKLDDMVITATLAAVHGTGHTLVPRGDPRRAQPNPLREGSAVSQAAALTAVHLPECNPAERHTTLTVFDFVYPDDGELTEDVHIASNGTFATGFDFKARVSYRIWCAYQELMEGTALQAFGNIYDPHARSVANFATSAQLWIGRKKELWEMLIDNEGRRTTLGLLAKWDLFSPPYGTWARDTFAKKLFDDGPVDVIVPFGRGTFGIAPNVDKIVFREPQGHGQHGHEYTITSRAIERKRISWEAVRAPHLLLNYE